MQMNANANKSANDSKKTGDKAMADLLAKKKTIQERLDVQLAKYEAAKKEQLTVLEAMDRAMNVDLNERKEVEKAIRQICAHNENRLVKQYHASGQDDDGSYSWICSDCGQEFRGGGPVSFG
jgi:hypothetical protein